MTLPRPEVLVFDVNETLSDMAPMAQRFLDVGAPGQLAATWFAALLRDGFALAAAGSAAAFADIGAGILRNVLEPLDLDRDLDDAVGHVMAGFGDLGVHEDVPSGLRRLAESGVRLVTLSNGATSVAEGLLERAGLSSSFERLMSVEEAGVWKPAPGAYEYALRECAVDPAAAMLVAVHPWDIDGASRVGMATGWINRSGATYPRYFSPPALEASSLVDLADRLGRP